jgi:hypothetical protein
MKSILYPLVLITAALTVSQALPQPKPDSAEQSLQTTSRPGGIAVGGDIKNTTLTFGLTPEQVRELTDAAARGATGPLTTSIVDLSRRLGVTEDATKTLLRMVGEQRDVPTERLPEMLSKVATDFVRLQKQVAALTPDNPMARALAMQAMTEVDAGHPERAKELMRQANQAQIDAERETRRFHVQIEDWLLQRSGTQIVAVGGGLVVLGWMLTLLLLYWLDPARLVTWHETFPEPEALENASKTFEKITFGATTVINWIANVSILFLSTSDRALSAWVAQRVDTARAIFTARPTVHDRRIALDLPVRIDTVRRDEPWSELRRLMSRNAPLAMLISGPGGAGKTTLACRIGRRSLGAIGQPSLGTHTMLPLLVEADVPEEAAQPNGLRPFLAGLLRPALAENRPISPTLTKALLRSGRVLVIVDGLSERSIATRQTFDPQKQGFEINRLIVTSRERELPGMSVAVETETIPSGALFDFIERYLREMKENGEGEIPSKDRIHYAAGDLERLLGDTPCTPLLAAMWAKEIGALPQPEALRPRGVASLIESYIRRILLPAANSNETLVDRLTKDATKIAERELGGRYLPGYVTRATALDVMRALDPSDPDRRFGLLERSRLLESPSQHSDAVHIAPDPVAEHLVARFRTEELGSDAKAWRSFLAQLRKQGWPAGFTAALVACVDDTIYGAQVPLPICQLLKGVQDNSADTITAA